MYNNIGGYQLTKEIKNEMIRIAVDGCHVKMLFNSVKIVESLTGKKITFNKVEWKVNQ